MKIVMYYTMVKAENKDEDKEYNINKSVVVSLWESYWNHAFQIIKNVYPLPLKSNHQIFQILTICQIYFSYLRTLLLEIFLWSRLL